MTRLSITVLCLFVSLICRATASSGETVDWPGHTITRPALTNDPHASVKADINRTGVNFELNKGQWPSQVAFKTDIGNGRRLFLEKDRFTYVLYDPRQIHSIHEAEHDQNTTVVKNEQVNLHAFQMKFVGCNPSCTIRPGNPLSFHHNYFIGSDPEKWASEVPLYTSLNYEELYRNIALSVDGSGGRFKYDYIVNPGAELASIQLQFEGATSIRVEEDRLYIFTSVGELVESIPSSYQMIEGKKIPVKCRYLLNEKNGTVGFVAPEGYDTNYVLVVDPVVLASTYSGSSANTYGHCGTYDLQGNIYTGGRCFGSGYPVSLGAFQGLFGGYVDIAISKLNSTGSALLYATYLGGSSDDYPHSLYVNGNNELFILGSSSSTNFPTSQGCIDNTFNGGTSDIVVSKLNPAGSVLLGSTYIGGSAADGINTTSTINYGDLYRGEIIVNNAGEPYIVSSSSSGNFPVTSGAYDVSYNGGQDAVVLKLNSNLTGITWSTYFGGIANEAGFGIRIASSGNVFLTGNVSGNGLPTSTTAIHPSIVGGQDGFVACLNAAGNTLINATYVGTPGIDAAYFIDLDYNNDVYIYGVSFGSIPISTGVYSNPGSQGYIMKLTQGLNSIVYSTVLGNGSHQPFSPSAFMIDQCQDIYMSGWGTTTNFPVTPNAFQSTTDGSDFYLMVLKANATSLVYGTFYGSSTTWEHVDGGTSRFNPLGIVYQAVCECSSSLPTLPSAYATTGAAAGCDIAVFKIDFQTTCNPLDVTICHGSVATLTIINSGSLANPTYSYQPGGSVSSSPVFTVSPSGTSTYTVYVTGVNQANVVATHSSIATVSVKPQPVLNPILLQANCSSTVNSFNLGLGFTPSTTTAPGYTINWSPLPNGIVSPTQTAASGGIAAGNYNATVTAASGCTASTTFSINPPLLTSLFYLSGSPVLTCNQPTATVFANPAINTYTWTNGQYSFFSPTVSLSQIHLGTWTVTNINPSSNCSSSLTFAVTQNTSAVSSTLSPLFQTINCSITAAPAFTALGSPTVNIGHYWLSPFGGTLAVTNASATFVPGGPGTYTHLAVNLANGCTVSKTFTVFSLSGFPTYSVSSPQNFTLGCHSKTVVTINIVGAQTTPSGGAVSYTLLGPSSGSVYAPGNISTYTVAVPGTWTVITRDNSNLCETKVQVSVIQNTLGPDMKALVPQQVLSCDVPSVLLEGQSTTPNVSYMWTYPGTTSVVSTSSIVVTNNTLAITNTLVANFTLNITDNNNTCISQSIIPIYQNLLPPVANFSGLSDISCKTQTLNFTNISTSRVPAFFNPVLPVIGYLWSGPSPQPSLQVSSTYIGYLPGTYTLLAKDLNNGCISYTTRTVSDARAYPVLNDQGNGAQFIYDCASVGAEISPNVYDPESNYNYAWAAVPSVSFSSLNGRNILVNRPGIYYVTVTNTVSGCAIGAYVEVIEGSLNADFIAEPDSGFAPMSVAFINRSASSATINASSGILSVWSFGNGYSTVSQSVNDPVYTTYHTAGTYTVTLFANKGACRDTAVRIIHVEVPSRLDIPDAFSPNGDSVNDVFFVRAAGLLEISALIYDRWGNKVYELNRVKGNIAWDGKGMNGADCAEGGYFYIIKASGNDGKLFKYNGTIHLFR